MNIAIIGAGLIGRKRAYNLPSDFRLKTVCDVNEDAGRKLASECKCNFSNNWKITVNDPGIRAIIISTTHNYLFPIAETAAKNDKHIFIEKPGARNIDELRKLAALTAGKQQVIMVGYNHRFHPAIIKAKKITDSAFFGRILFIRARYGHGGRVGYGKEWRSDKRISGGGELLDQGSHLIDLVNFFIGNKIIDLDARLGNFFWDSKVEDAAFIYLKNNQNQAALLSTSWVEWKNIFSFEIILERAKLQIDGLGGSYGPEKLTVYKMKPEMGPPKITEYLFKGDDLSWEKELRTFSLKIRKKNYSRIELNKAQFVLDVIDKIYSKQK